MKKLLKNLITANLFLFLLLVTTNTFAMDKKQPLNSVPNKAITQNRWGNISYGPLSHILVCFDFDPKEMGITYENLSLVCKNWRGLCKDRLTIKFYKLPTQALTLNRLALHGYPSLVLRMFDVALKDQKTAVRKRLEQRMVQEQREQQEPITPEDRERRILEEQQRQEQLIRGEVLCHAIMGCYRDCKAPQTPYQETVVRVRDLCSQKPTEAKEVHIVRQPDHCATIALLTPAYDPLSPDISRLMCSAFDESTQSDNVHPLLHLCHDTRNHKFLIYEEGMIRFLNTATERNCMRILTTLLDHPFIKTFHEFRHFDVTIAFGSNSTPRDFYLFLLSMITGSSQFPDKPDSTAQILGKILVQKIKTGIHALVEYTIGRRGSQLTTAQLENLLTAAQTSLESCETETREQELTQIIDFLPQHLKIRKREAAVLHAQDEVKQPALTLETMSLPDLQKQLEKANTVLEFDTCIQEINKALESSGQEAGTRANAFGVLIAGALRTIALQGNSILVQHILTIYGPTDDERQAALVAVQAQTPEPFGQAAQLQQQIIDLLTKK